MDPCAAHVVIVRGSATDPLMQTICSWFQGGRKPI